MHDVKGEEVDALDGGDVFPSDVGKVIARVLNRDFVFQDFVLYHRFGR